MAAEISHLTGRRVRRLEEGREVSAGGYAIPWDGQDEADELVLPGVCSVRLKPPSTPGVPASAAGSCRAWWPSPTSTA